MTTQFGDDKVFCLALNVGHVQNRFCNVLLCD